MTKYTMLIFAFIFSISISIHARDKILRLEQFIDLAKKNDPDFEKIQSDRSKLDYLVDKNLPSRKILLSLQSEHEVASSNNQDSSKTTASISKDIISTGTNLSLTQINTEKAGSVDKETEVRMEQSIYKNFMGRDVRLKKDALNVEREIVKLQILDSYENYISEISKIYLDFAQSYINLKLAREISRETLRLENNVLKKRKKNIATRTDVNRIKLHVILKKEDVINREIEYVSVKEKVKRIIGKELDNEIPEIDINLPAGYSFGSDITKIKNKSLRVYKIQQLNENIASKNYLLSKRELYPDVNLVAGYNYNKNKTDTSSSNNNEAIVGIKINIPIGDSTAKADKKSELLKFMKSKIERKKVFKDTEQQFKEQKNRLEQLKKKLELSREKVRVAGQILEDEKRRYLYAKLTLERLIEIKNDFAEYRFKYNTDLINFNKSCLEWLNLNDMLLAQKSLNQ